MYLRDKYKPELPSELEIEYPKIIDLINKGHKFIVNGSKECGKTTIVKLYLKLLNYDYLLIDNYSEESSVLLESINNICKNPMTYFNNKKYIILIDNFDNFDTQFKEKVINSKLQIIIVTNHYLNVNINYVHINNYSCEYINNLYYVINYLENSKYTEINTNFDNINKMFTLLENSNNDVIFDSYSYKYNDYLFEKDLSTKLYILNKLDSYSEFQINLIHNIIDIDNLDKCYSYLINSFQYINFPEYYELLCFLGCGQYVKSKFKIVDKYKQVIKKKNIDMWIPKILKKRIKMNKNKNE